MSRIIAGRYGGRRITMPKTATRPTTDRVREALFSAVSAWAGRANADPAQALSGLGFCDLYAGSGAVGLEASSRGAGPVLLVESDRRTSAVAKTNIAALSAPVELRVGAVERQLAEPRATPFDIVFADPPYELDGVVLAGLLADAVDQGWVADDGLVVVERSTRTPELPWPSALGEGWERRYGETVLYFRTPPPT